MFRKATNFNQPIGNWVTSKMTNMYRMFYEASNFNQDISNWDIRNITSMSEMFTDSGLQSNNYDLILEKWSSQIVKSAVPLGGTFYCKSQQYRDILTSVPNNWIITDLGKNCPTEDIILPTVTIVGGSDSKVVGTLSIIDEEDTPSSFSLISGVGGEDNDKFEIDPVTNTLLFKETPYYYNPTDTGYTADSNTYSVLIRSTDVLGVYTDRVFLITVTQPPVSVTESPIAQPIVETNIAPKKKTVYSKVAVASSDPVESTTEEDIDSDNQKPTTESEPNKVTNTYKPLEKPEVIEEEKNDKKLWSYLLPFLILFLILLFLLYKRRREEEDKYSSY